jgi:5'-deoxynucleotidase YfbR-like HD superfamily hydrolase
MTTVIAWILFDDINSEVGNKLDLLKLLKLSLLHDLPKIYTGDTSVWDKHLLDFKDQISIDKEIISTIMFQWLPNEIQDEMKDIYTGYLLTIQPDQAGSNEATVMRAVERIAPAIQRLITKQGWKKIPAAEEDLDKIQLSRISISPTLVEMYEIVKEEAKEEGLL